MKVEVIALSSYENKEEKFKEEVPIMRYYIDFGSLFMTAFQFGVFLIPVAFNPVLLIDNFLPTIIYANKSF